MTSTYQVNLFETPGMHSVLRDVAVAHIGPAAVQEADKTGRKAIQYLAEVVVLALVISVSIRSVKARRIVLVGSTLPLTVYRCKCFLALKRARRVEPALSPTPDELELAKARRAFLLGNYRQARVILRPLRPRMPADDQDWMLLDGAVRLLAVKDSIEQASAEFQKLSDEGMEPERWGSWTQRLCRGKYEGNPPAINASDWIGSLLLLNWLEQYRPGNEESLSEGERKAQLQGLRTWMTVEQVGDEGVALYDRLQQASNLQSALGQVTQAEVDALQARCQLPEGRFWCHG